METNHKVLQKLTKFETKTFQYILYLKFKLSNQEA
jgi:hypothetical protein